MNMTSRKKVLNLAFLCTIFRNFQRFYDLSVFLFKRALTPMGKVLSPMESQKLITRLDSGARTT